tara:strand:- start:1306 stop:1593 length:288 start_codon:yes stop_codon:yes gene_type:complete
MSQKTAKLLAKYALLFPEEHRDKALDSVQRIWEGTPKPDRGDLREQIQGMVDGGDEVKAQILGRFEAIKAAESAEVLAQYEALKKKADDDTATSP